MVQIRILKLMLSYHIPRVCIHNMCLKQHLIQKSVAVKKRCEFLTTVVPSNTNIRAYLYSLFVYFLELESHKIAQLAN